MKRFILCIPAAAVKVVAIFWQTGEIGKPEWGTSEAYGSYKARLANREQLTREMDEALSTATTAEWLERLSGTVPVTPVYDIAQALDSDYVKAQGGLMEAAHPVRGTIRSLACPVRLPGEAPRVGIAPRLGEQTGELLRGLGYDDGRIERLRAGGAL